MTPEDKGHLLMLCGALNDIAEKSHEVYTKWQIEAVQYNIEAIIIGSLSKKAKQEFDLLNI